MSRNVAAFSCCTQKIFFSTYLCGFRKDYNTQQVLVRFVVKCNSVLHKKNSKGLPILMGLSKEFDCLNHALLIAQLPVNGFSRPALKLIYSYKLERQQRVEINGSFTTLKQTLSTYSPRLGFGTPASQHFY